MASEKIIIFGPTGQVAAAAAITAQAKGAKVSLAMRDVNKTIPGLSPEKEQSGGFERVQADLTKPETIKAAVEKTGAKRAFIYLLFGKPMRASIEALKSAGIDFVVFNSSLSVKGDIREISKSSYIAWEHAQVEIALEEVFGVPNYVAVRPGAFASNTFTWKDMVAKGELKVVYPEAVFSYIAPSDIGRVCGTLLVKGPQVLETRAGRNAVSLTGPELLTQREAAATIGRVIGRELRVESIDEKAGIKFLVEKMGMPEHGAAGVVGQLKGMAESGRDNKEYRGPVFEEAKSNVETYTGKPSTTFAQWVEENRAEFQA